jgi:hypothetical protein
MPNCHLCANTHLAHGGVAQHVRDALCREARVDHEPRVAAQQHGKHRDVPREDKCGGEYG